LAKQWVKKNYILKDKADCLKIFVYASLEERINRIVSVYGESDVAPEKRLKDKDKWHVQYLKGLGEMNPDQLWESTLNPETRKLYKLTIEDAEKCAKVVNDIMGKDSEARKKLVLNNFTIEG